MNLFQLVLKQMRQRALSTWLTLLSVTLGVALASAVLIFYREGGKIFGQTEFGYDVLIGPPKGSALQLVMNTIYQIDQSPGVIPYSVYEDLMKDRGNVRIAVPYAVGDTYKNHRIIGTVPKLFGFDDQGKAIPPERTLEYKRDQRYQFKEGRVFHPQKFEAVIGSDISERTGLKLGGKFKATHGMPEPGAKPDEHDTEWEVVGVLNRTGTASDRVIFIPLVSFYAVAEHKEGLELQALARGDKEPATTPATEPKDAHDEHDGHDHGHGAFELIGDGIIDLKLPKSDWVLSAILVKSRSSIGAMGMIYRYKVIDNRASAVNPATVMREFFDTFLKGSTLALLMIALLVSVVAAVGILVSIYNSVSARMREVAILRALGATRAKVLIIICLEAGLIGLCGGLLGLILGHLLGAVASTYLQSLLSEKLAWHRIDSLELLYLLAVVVLSVLAGLVPALKAYRTPVATNLVAV